LLNIVVLLKHGLQNSTVNVKQKQTQYERDPMLMREFTMSD